MISLKLENKEKLQFKYLLPNQGSLKSLDLVERILKKVEIKEGFEGIENIDFDEEEINFLEQMIYFLDQQQQINFNSLSLVRKILNLKGDLNV